MGNTILESIGSNIRTLRRKQGLTQADLAKMAGIARCQLSYTENGEVNVTLLYLSKIAEALRVEVKDLL